MSSMMFAFAPGEPCKCDKEERVHHEHDGAALDLKNTAGDQIVAVHGNVVEMGIILCQRDATVKYPPTLFQIK